MSEGIWWRQSLYTSRPWGLIPLNQLHAQEYSREIFVGLKDVCSSTDREFHSSAVLPIWELCVEFDYWLDQITESSPGRRWWESEV